MSPAELDVEVVGRRLRLLRDALDDLDSLEEVSTERLRAEPVTRAAVERLLQVVVDLAVEINAHISVARLHRAPDTARSSFPAAAEAGVLPIELAERLAPAAGLRNVLVHRYVDIDPARVAESVGPALDGFGEYVRVVARALPDGD